MKKISRFDLAMIIAFVVITLLGGGVWYYLSGLLATAQDDVNDAKQKFDQYSTHEVYLPTKANQKILQDNIDLIKAKLDPLVQASLQAPDNKLSTIEKQDTVAWKHDLDQEVAKLNALAKTHGVDVPPNFYYGFSRYLNQNPIEAQTVVLSKQLLAIEQIATIFINAPVKSIHAIRRTDEEDAGGMSALTTSEYLSGHSVDAEGSVYTTYPFEIDFDATTDSFRKVIDDLMQSPYVFVVRTLSVANSHPASPRVDDLVGMAGTAEAAAPSVVNSSPGEVAATAAAHSDKGPQFLFGAETLRIKMRIDLIEWKGVALDTSATGAHAPHNPAAPGATPAPGTTSTPGGT
jgi:hypothetical protein